MQLCFYRLSALHPYAYETFDDLWRSFQTLFLRLYKSRLIVVNVVNGGNFAGGVVLALAADYRIAADARKAVWSLSESKVGLPVPG
jgi:enoyl-CoA hydratase/carnithine racemase